MWVTQWPSYWPASVGGRAAERIIGPWGSFNFGPLAYLSLYIILLCCMKALVLLQRGVWGFSPRKNFNIILENGAILCILVAQNGNAVQAYHNHIGIDKCSGPQGNTPTSPPFQWAWWEGKSVYIQLIRTLESWLYQFSHHSYVF